MWDVIISLFYRQSCRSSLVEMRKHHLAGSVLPRQIR
jgi:hypothetical protein